ncbi:hypothetical protein C8R44DRAFT_761630 [Mycena epipterygia]|nr:hypothetical protein C8R44DRAFT_761630 [Mycena epipterygia]
MPAGCATELAATCTPRPRRCISSECAPMLLALSPSPLAPALPFLDTTLSPIQHFSSRRHTHTVVSYRPRRWMTETRGHRTSVTANPLFSRQLPRHLPTLTRTPSATALRPRPRPRSRPPFRLGAYEALRTILSHPLYVILSFDAPKSSLPPLPSAMPVKCPSAPLPVFPPPLSELTVAGCVGPRVLLLGACSWAKQDAGCGGARRRQWTRVRMVQTQSGRVVDAQAQIWMRGSAVLGNGVAGTQITGR